MARVSRALSGLALDVLWRYIDDIFHLIDVVSPCYTHKSDDKFREQIVSSCIVACGSTRLVVIVDNRWSSFRGSLVFPTNESCFLLVSMRLGYESLSSHATVSNMKELLHCYVGSLTTSLSYHNCADWTGTLTGIIGKCHQLQRQNC